MAFNVILSVWMSVKSILMSNNRDTSFLGRYLNWIQGTRMKILSIHLLSFFIFSQAAYADFWDWLTPTPNVPAHSVSDHQVQSASCLTERLTRYGKSDLFFQDYFDELKSGEKESSTYINGKTFKNQYKNMSDLYRLLTGYGNFRMDGSCEDIECEIYSLFGKTYAQKLTYIAKEFSFNASSLVNKKGSSFSESELDVIIWSFEQLPKFMFPPRMKKMVKDNHSYPGDLGLRIATMNINSGTMTFFKVWINSSLESKAYTIMHEFGHLIGAKLSIHESLAWIKLSNWDKIKGDQVNKADNLLSKYSRASHLEDFAESFAAYRMNARTLKSKAPKKFELIKEIAFLGKEYLNNDCGSSFVDEIFQLENLSSVEIEKTCEFQLLGYRLGLKDLGTAMGCLSNNGDKIKLNSFEPKSGVYRAKINENFKQVNYPFIPRDKQKQVSNNIIENLEMIERE